MSGQIHTLLVVALLVPYFAIGTGLLVVVFGIAGRGTK